VGGVAAQEVLKAVTREALPLQQWLLLDCREVVGSNPSVDAQELQPGGSPSGDARYEPISAAVGCATLERMASWHTFLVGCGAIGCEMLKNLALLGCCQGRVQVRRHALRTFERKLMV
jgi:hypothetical protein